MFRFGKFAATPLPVRKCWENSQKSACESVAEKIRYPDVSFFKEPDENRHPAPARIEGLRFLQPSEVATIWKNLE
jgi:hypothetical protein